MKIKLLILLISISMLFVSCNIDHLEESHIQTNQISDNTDNSSQKIKERKDYGYIPASYDYMVYGDFYFDSWSSGATDIIYQNILMPIEGGTSLFSVHLGNDDKTTVNINGELMMLVDKYATKENGDIPVLLLSYNPVFDWDGVSIPEESDYNNTTVIIYNMKTREIDLIAEGLPADWISMGLYDETIYFTCLNGDKGTLLYKINLDGNGLMCLDEDLEDTLQIITADDEYVYFSANSNGFIYKCKNDFSFYEAFAETIIPYGFLFDDSLCYLGDLREYLEEDGTISYYRSVYKKKTDGTSEDVFLERSFSLYWDEDNFYMIGASPIDIGGYIHNGNNIVYQYDPETKEKTQILDLTGYKNKGATILCLSGDTALLKMTEYTSGFYSGCADILFYNIKTGMLKTVCKITKDPKTGSSVYEYVVEP